MAYLRALDVGNPSKADAEKAYSAKGDYKALQDYIFRFLATECGRLGMAIHIHVCASAGAYFDIAGTNPLLLEPMLHDPATRKTNFVLLHGGWPFIGEITALLTNPNVYTDFSEQTYTSYPREVSVNIRKWLEYEPEKSLFATDAYAFSKEIGWERSGLHRHENRPRGAGVRPHRYGARRRNFPRPGRGTGAHGPERKRPQPLRLQLTLPQQEWGGPLGPRPIPGSAYATPPSRSPFSISDRTPTVKEGTASRVFRLCLKPSTMMRKYSCV